MRTREDGVQVTENLSEAEAYDRGYDAGVKDAETDAYYYGKMQGRDEGYEEGYEDALREHKNMKRVVEAAAINPLEDFCGRWDAPLRAWVLRQGERAVVVREEDG